jgi:hypothetical protein
MDRQLSTLQDLHQAALSAFPALDAAEPDERIFDLVSAYASLIEFAGSVEFLARHAHWTVLPPLVRTMLETYVDLLNLHSDPDYTDYIAARDHQEARALLRGFRNPQGPLARWIATQPDMESLLETLVAGMSEVAPGVKPLGVRERFKMAGLMDAYDLIYRPLSSSVHSNRSALRGRHAERQGDQLRVTLHLPREKWERVMLVGLPAQILSEASILAYGACGCVVPDDLARRLSELASDGA